MRVERSPPRAIVHQSLDLDGGGGGGGGGGFTIGGGAGFAPPLIPRPAVFGGGGGRGLGLLRLTVVSLARCHELNPLHLFRIDEHLRDTGDWPVFRPYQP